MFCTQYWNFVSTWSNYMERNESSPLKENFDIWHVLAIYAIHFSSELSHKGFCFHPSIKSPLESECPDCPTWNSENIKTRALGNFFFFSIYLFIKKGNKFHIYSFRSIMILATLSSLPPSLPPIPLHVSFLFFLLIFYNDLLSMYYILTNK